MNEAQASIDTEAIAWLDWGVRVVGFDDLTVAHDAQPWQKGSDVDANCFCLLAPPPVDVVWCGAARCDGCPTQANLFPDRGPFDEAAIHGRFPRCPRCPEIALKQLGAHFARRQLRTDGFIQVAFQRNAQPIGHRECRGHVETDSARIARLHDVREIWAQSFGPIAVVDELVVKAGGEVLARRMRENEDLLEPLTCIKEDVRVADTSLSAELRGEGIRVVLAVQRDPHVDLMPAHERQQQRVDLVDDQVALDHVALALVWDAERLSREALGLR